MLVVNRTELNRILEALIDATAEKGRIYSVTFTKKDGTEREMTVQQRMGAHYVKGTGAATAAKAKLNHPNIKRVYDFQEAMRIKREGGDLEKAWRSINLDTVTRLKVDGREYHIRTAL